LSAPTRADARSAVAPLIEQLREELRKRVGELLPAGTRVALLDFPNHDNVGDTSIWLGELALLRELGCEVAYMASFSSYSAAEMRRRLGADGVVLLHGGGNLGDLWPTYQAFRERVIETHHDRRIVQLPQTVNFSGPAPLARTAAGFNAHPDLTIMVRDQPSEDLARDAFEACRVVAAPDSALALGPLDGPEPTGDVLVLMRTDRERVEREAGGIASIDWPTRSGSALRTSRYRLSRLLGYPAKRSSLAARLLDRPLRRVFDSLAEERFGVVPELLGSPSAVVTDRLHAHILCLLLGRPQVLLEDRGGKVRGFVERWTAGSPITHWATGVEAGVELARSLAR
jgi:exopolysaccharide biosynthesis predicted pyruvyltransferase EpsI